MEAIRDCAEARRNDAYEPTPRDQHIPGRLPFALALRRANLEARAAAPDHLLLLDRPTSPDTPAAPTPPPAPSPLPTLATPLAQPLAAPPVCPHSPHPLRPTLRLIATRRGSILDVLA